MNRRARYRLIVISVAAASLVPTMGIACNSPLVLDLSGNGLDTTGVDQGVLFDLDGDGIVEKCGWTDPYQSEAFLWLDLNGNGKVDNGRELFGNSTATPDGSVVTNGFEALAIYDRLELGGNGDHKISPEDWIWSSLRLWIDRDHNGQSSAAEISTLDDWGILSINVSYHRKIRYDGNYNVLAFWGKFKTTEQGELRERDIADIFFLTEEP